MAALVVHPDYRAMLGALSLHTPAAFLRLGGVVYSGHPDRNVMRLTLGTAAGGLDVFLKREHRTPRRDRLSNYWSGFGFVSKSLREWKLLADLKEHDVRGPRAVAAGEDGQGRAFLMLLAEPDAESLREYLVRHPGADERATLARRAARAVGESAGKFPSR